MQHAVADGLFIYCIKYMKDTLDMNATIAIGNRAKTKAYDMMIYVFDTLLLVFVSMDRDLYMIPFLVHEMMSIYNIFSYVIYLINKETKR